MKILQTSSSFYTKEQTPKFKVTMWDTAFTWPSRGLIREAYQFTDGIIDVPTATSNTLIYSGIDTNTFDYFAQGAPPGITKLNNYALRWHGYIFPSRLQGDYIIFDSYYEDGNLDEWGSVYGTNFGDIVATGVAAYVGNYGLKVDKNLIATNNGPYLSQQIAKPAGGYETTFTEFWFNVVSSGGWIANDNALILHMAQGGWDLLKLRVKKNGGKYDLTLVANNSDNTSFFNDTVETGLILNTWHKVKIKWIGRDDGTGGFEFWLDNVSKASDFTRNTRTYQQVHFGIKQTTNSAQKILLYSDDFIIKKGNTGDVVVVGAIGMGGNATMYVDHDGGSNYIFSDTRLSESKYVTGAVTFDTSAPREIEFWYEKVTEDEGGYCFFWEENGNIHPFGAGYCNITSASLTSQEIFDIKYLKISKQREAPALMEFTIPLITKTTASILPYNGYVYDHTYDSLHHVSSAADGTYDYEIKKNRLIHGKIGYISGGVDELYNEFKGHIVNWEVNSKSGLATVTCLDFSNLLNYRINENWPDKASYWVAKYTDDSDPNLPDGKDKPIAYDGWPLGKALRDLLLKCNIDERLFSNSNRQRRYTGDIYAYKDMFYDYDVVLRRPVNYGNPNISWADAERYGINVDDQYLYPSEISETVYNRVYNILDQFGYLISFDESGYPEIVARNNPYEIMGGRMINYSSQWTSGWNMGAISGQYWTNVTGNITDADFFNDYNLLSNPSFEDGNLGFLPTNWTTGTGFDNKLFEKQPGGMHNIYQGMILSIDGQTTDFYQDIIFAKNTHLANDLIGCSVWYQIHPYPTISDSHEEVVSVIDEPHIVNTLQYFNQFGNKNNPIIQSESVFSITANFAPIDRTANITVEWPNIDGPNILRKQQLEIDYNTGYIRLPAGYFSGGETVYLTYSYDMDAKIIFTLHQDPGNDQVKEKSTTAIYSHRIDPYPNLNNWKKLTLYDNVDNSNITGFRFHINFKSWAEDPTNSDFRVYCGFDYAEMYNYTALYDSSRDNILNAASGVFKTSGASRIDLIVGLIPFGGRLNYDVIGAEGNIIKTGYIDTFYSEELFFYDDIEYTVAVNPCQFKILGQQDSSGFGAYEVRFFTSGAVRINGVFIYDEDKDVPLYGFSSDTVLENIDVKRRSENLRNDAIVIGSRRFLRVAEEDQNEREINPANPLIPYIISRSTDVGSIYNPESINYIGMPITTVIIDDSIINQRHANWLSFSIIEKFRVPQPESSLRLIGFPVVQLYDSVAIIDRRYGLISIDKPSITQSYTHYLDNSRFYTIIDLTAYEEFASFEPRKRIPDWLVPDNVANFQIKYPGKQKSGDKYITSGTVINPNYETEILSGAPLNSFPFYDPYFSEGDNGKFVEITFDIARAGYYDVAIMAGPGISYNPAGTVVAWLTNIESAQDDNSAHWEYFEQSTNNKFYWDGVDMVGNWNREFGTNLDNGFAEEVQGAGWYVHNNESNTSQTITVNNGISDETIRFGRFWVRIRSRDTNAPLGNNNVGDVVTFNSYKMDKTYNDVSASYIYTNLGYVTQCQVHSILPNGTDYSVGPSTGIAGGFTLESLITPRYINNEWKLGTGMILRVRPDAAFVDREYEMFVNAACKLFGAVHFQSPTSLNKNYANDAKPVDIMIKGCKDIPINEFPKKWTNFGVGTTTATFYPDDYEYEYEPGTRSITWQWEETGLPDPREQFANHPDVVDGGGANNMRFVIAYLAYVFYFNTYIRDKSGRIKYCYGDQRPRGNAWADNDSSSGGFFENIQCFARNYFDPRHIQRVKNDDRWNFDKGFSKNKTSAVCLPIVSVPGEKWFRVKNTRTGQWEHSFWTVNMHYESDSYIAVGLWNYNQTRAQKGDYINEEYSDQRADEEGGRISDPDGGDHVMAWRGFMNSNVAFYPYYNNAYQNALQSRGDWTIYQTRGNQDVDFTYRDIDLEPRPNTEPDNQIPWAHGPDGWDTEKMYIKIRAKYNVDEGYSYINWNALGLAFDGDGMGWPDEGDNEWTGNVASIVVHLCEYPVYGT